MHKNVKKVLYTNEEIVKRSIELAKEINRDYAGKKVIFIGLLSGCIPFLAELIKHIELDCELDYMDVSSYHGTTSSSGEVRILKDLTRSIADEEIIIVEDIVDTGRTLNTVVEMLKYRNAKSVKVVTLLDKPEGRAVDFECEYVGFVIPNEFVIGFGLDYDELYRNLPYVGVLKEECYM